MSAYTPPVRASDFTEDNKNEDEDATQLSALFNRKLTDAQNESLEVLFRSRNGRKQ